MKIFIVVALMLSLSAGTLLAQTKTAPKTKKEMISYSIGVNIGKDLKMKTQELDINNAFLLQGIKDAVNGSKTTMSEKDIEATMMAFQQEMAGKMKNIAEKNKKEGDAFLEANKKKDGVITLPSGLQYKVIKEGSGAKPTATQTVKCNYRGTLIDGKEFDSSYKRGEPTEFPVGQVIKGWTEALQLMPVGSKWQLFIPSNLAYGENGGGSMIGPNAALIFDIELISIK
jgi:FKBP-type peptidyl-prolyl cis-trans isomerase FklB